MPAEPPPTPRFSRALESRLRDEAARRRRFRLPVPPPRVVVVLAAVVVAVVFAVVPASDGERTREHSSTSDLPVLRVTTTQLLEADRAEIMRLKQEFRLRGAILAIRDRWVKNPRADGRVFSVQTPVGVGREEYVKDGRRMSRAVPFTVNDKLPGPIILAVGKAGGKKPKRDPRSIYEAIPKLCELVDPADPDGTLEALREAGFDVVVTTVPWNREGEKQIVISVLDGEGRYRNVDPDTKQLIVEVGTPGEGHHGGSDATCTR